MKSNIGSRKTYFGPVTFTHIILLISLTIIWSSSFVVIKIGVESLSPITLTTLRLTVGFLALAFISIIKNISWPITTKLLNSCFWSALFGCSLPFFLISWGETKIESGIAAILMSIMPLITLFLSHFFTKGDRLTIQKIIGIALGFVGIIILVGPGAMAEIGNQLSYQCATASAAACYAVNIIIMRNMDQPSILSRSTIILGLATLQLAPVSIIVDPINITSIDPVGLTAILYLGLLPTALAMLLFFKLVSVREPSFVSYVNYILPVFGLGWGAVILDETFSFNAIICLCLILAGMLVANLSTEGNQNSR